MSNPSEATEASIFQRVERVERLPEGALVHPRMLDLPERGGRSWIFASFHDAGDAKALHQAAMRVVESAWLAELSRPPADFVPALPRIQRLEFFCFGALPAGYEDALAPFGLHPAAMDSDAESHLKLLRAEASRASLDTPDAPNQLLRAEVRYTSAADAEGGLARALGSQIFGQTPGAFASALTRLNIDGVEPGMPTLEGLDRLEQALVSSEEEVVRAIPPVLLQACADWVGVCVANELEREVAWAVSEPGLHGLPEPPLLRLDDAKPGEEHFPIGLHLLRFWIMPRRRGEQAMKLSHWLRETFAR